MYDAVFDGHIVLGTTCDRIPVDYVDWRDMVADTSFAQLVNYDPRWIDQPARARQEAGARACLTRSAPMTRSKRASRRPTNTTTAPTSTKRSSSTIRSTKIGTSSTTSGADA